MNNQSPLVPQGSFLEQKNKGRARVKIAVFVVLAIHGIGLLALLMQGCKKEPESTPIAGAEDTNTVPGTATAQETNTVPPFTNPIMAAATSNVPTTAEAATSSVPSALAPGATEYKVLKGDNYTTIARKFHTSTRALMDANPGVDPTKLQIGQSLHIPAPSTSAAAGSATGTAPGADLTTGEQTYSVQSGDTLSKIADKFKVSVKAIQSANNLTTTRIRVGQKLKIPVKATAAATSPTNGGTSSPPPQ
jgi:LysM repeat protein